MTAPVFSLGDHMGVINQLPALSSERLGLRGMYRWQSLVLKGEP